MKTLAIIPARGGSKGIPHKNIIDINGKPLIAYTIEVGLEALNSGVIDELIVSTDDEEIIRIAKDYNVNVPFIRPAELSNDTAKSSDVMIHAYNFYKEDKNVIFDTLLLLQPTTPLRTSADIIKSIKLFKENQAESLISCFKEEYICDLVSYHKEGDYAVPLNSNHNKGIRRQELQDLYVRNGAIYIVNSEYLLDTKQIISDAPLLYVMEKNNSVNIDCYDDIELLKWRTK